MTQGVDRQRDVPPPVEPAGRRTRPSAGAGLAVLALVALAVVGLAMLVAAVLPGSDEAASTVGASEDRDDGFRFWATNDDGEPVRWDPCSRLHLVVNDEGAPVDLADDLEEAVDIVADATGLDLEIVGETDEIPHPRREAYQPDRYGERWAPVLVAWAAPGRTELPMREADRGLAIPLAVGVEGDRTYVTGQVVLNAWRTDLEPGFDNRRDSWGATLLHELGHLLGLAHTDDPGELMAADPGEGPVEFGSGDLRGLAALGADGDCRARPAPQDVEVPDPVDERAPSAP